jgi:transcriptional repressor NrdR
MKCPYCGNDEDRVIDSRPVEEGKAIRRRRECSTCERRFTTYEYVERTAISVVKRDGRREPYDRDKLIGGVALACRKRPVSRDEIERIVNGIETGLADEYKTEIPSTELGERVLERLAELDQVSYVRFASVYRQFDDVDQFSKELRRLRKERNAEHKN